MCFLGSHVQPTSRWLEPLLEVLEAPGVGAAVPAAVDRDARSLPRRAIGPDGNLRRLDTPGTPERPEDHFEADATVVGAHALVAHRDALEHAGWLGEALVTPWEIFTDLVLRLRAVGLRTTRIPASRVRVTDWTTGAEPPDELEHLPAALSTHFGHAAARRGEVLVCAEIPDASGSTTQRRAFAAVTSRARSEGVEIAVACEDGYCNEQQLLELWRLGVAVALGPRDWTTWLARNAATPATVRVFGTRVAARLARHLEAAGIQVAEVIDPGSSGPTEPASATAPRLITPPTVEQTHEPLISILTPVFDTEPVFLVDAVASVRNQRYQRWELCMVDDGSTRADTRAALTALTASDERIKFRRRPASGGIVAATNDALEMAHGEFVAFLDHDDMLRPHALSSMVELLERSPALDIVYSDEERCRADGTVVDQLLKPDYSPSYLRACNYICHLLLVRRTLVEDVGGLRPGFDGSQDHDLLLRLTEVTHAVGHVRDVLYEWRMAPTSVAANASAKPYAATAARRALLESCARRGSRATVVDGPGDGLYRVREDVDGHPTVGIVSVDNRTVQDLASLARDAAGSDFVLFRDDRCEPVDDGWLAAMIEIAQDPGVGIVGARVNTTAGSPIHEGLALGLGGLPAPAVSLEGLPAHVRTIHEVAAVAGVCLLIRAPLLDHLGGLDDSYEHSLWDADLGLRARKAGYRVVYTPYAAMRWHGPWRAAPGPADRSRFVERWGRPADPYFLCGPMLGVAPMGAPSPRTRHE